MITLFLEKCPLYISEEVYNNWKVEWVKPRARLKSLQGKIARHGGAIDGPMSVRTYGSGSMKEHARRMVSSQLFLTLFFLIVMLLIT